MLEQLGKIRLYEDDWKYTSSIYMEVKAESVFTRRVFVIEFNNEITDPEIKRPNCQRRIISVRLKPLMKAINVSEDGFILEMKNRFGRFDGFDLLRTFLDEHGIDYDFREVIA